MNHEKEELVDLSSICLWKIAENPFGYDPTTINPEDRARLLEFAFVLSAADRFKEHPNELRLPCSISLNEPEGRYFNAHYFQPAKRRRQARMKMAWDLTEFISHSNQFD